MNLAEDAAAFVAGILRDVDHGFARPVRITAPDGRVFETSGLERDIGFTVDPDTGVEVAGRTASIAVPTVDLLAAGFELPENIPDTDSAPWLARWTPLTGVAQTMKIVRTIPDKLGSLVLVCARYRVAEV